MKKSLLLKLEGVRKSYLSKKPIFSNINMEVAHGEFLFLTGISGAGKSTMFKLITALEKPDKGEILFNGENIDNLNSKSIALHRRRIGVVFQDYKLLAKKTAAENIAFPLLIHGLSPFKVEEKIRKIAKKVEIEHLLTQRIQSLSGGEQQLVAIARASIHSPLLILADEPTANLDQKTAGRIINMLQMFNDEGKTIIIATHDINLIKAHRKRILLIKNGSLMEVSL